MNLIVLAAGYATRLYPLTRDFPKPLLPIAGKPLLDHLLDDIVQSDRIERAAVVTNSRFAFHFREWQSRRREQQKKIGINLPIEIVDDGSYTNETRLGAVADIRWTLNELGWNGETFIMAGDNLLDFSLVRFIEYYEKCGTNVLMCYYEPDDARLRKCGVLEIDGQAAVLSMEEKPPAPKSHWCAPPFYIYRGLSVHKIDEALADGCGVDAPGSLAAWICRHEPTRAFEMPGKRYDIGTVEQYEAVKETFSRLS